MVRLAERMRGASTALAPAAIEGRARIGVHRLASAFALSLAIVLGYGGLRLAGAETVGPRVETGPVSGVSETSATLTATVNPRGVPITECKLEYTATKRFGMHSVPCSPMPGEGGEPVAVSATITGLSKDTIYTYRLYASNAEHGAYGEPRKFTTPPAPPTVVDEYGFVASSTEEVLEARVNPNSTEVTECEFEYGKTKAYGMSTPCSSLPGAGANPFRVSATIAPFTHNERFDWRVVVTNAVGTGFGKKKRI